MPTFTTIALESLLEPKIRDSYKTSTKSVRDFSGNDKRKKELDEEEQQQKLKEKAPVRNRVNMSPALYIISIVFLSSLYSRLASNIGN